MKPQKEPRPSMRLNEDDQRIMDKLQAKLGLKTSQIFKLSIRALAEKEGIRL